LLGRFAWRFAWSTRQLTMQLAIHSTKQLTMQTAKHLLRRELAVVITTALKDDIGGAPRAASLPRLLAFGADP
jgi:hypothetical protein